MSGLDGTVTIQTSEYRPCRVGEKNAFFHRWIDKESVILKFNTGMKPEYQKSIIKTFNEVHAVPSSVTTERVIVSAGIVEFEDGSVKEVDPEMIKFLDSDQRFKEIGLFCKPKKPNFHDCTTFEQLKLTGIEILTNEDRISGVGRYKFQYNGKNFYKSVSYTDYHQYTSQKEFEANLCQEAIRGLGLDTEDER